MPAMTDFDLMQDYAARGSEAAFAALVNRYVNLVYSAASRQTLDPQTAEEITQAVFLVLARKAGGLPPDLVLSGWLVRTTRFVAWNVNRREAHRKKAEQEAMNLPLTETDAAWKRIAPLLDEALVDLNEKNRSAVTLRFFEKKSFKEIGRMLGTTEDGAQKRVARAVEMLRANLARRGAVLSAVLVVGAIKAGSVQAAPVELAGAVTTAAVSGGAAASVSALAQLTITAWQAARFKVLALRGLVVGTAAVLLLLTAHLVGWGKAPPPPTVADREEPALPPVPAALVAAAPVAVAPTSPGTMRFRVLDAEDQKPVVNARLTLTWALDLANSLTNVVATDGNGAGLLPIDRAPARNWKMRIEVFRDGYVPKYVDWSAVQGDDPKNLPQEYTTKMTRAVNIGGTVVNEKGEPIPEARVVFDGFPSGAYAEWLDRERLTFALGYHTETTDARGRWTCSHVPSQFGMIFFKVIHPDYLEQSFGSAELGAGTNQSVIYLAESELRNGTAVMGLRQGAPVAGIVMDEWGNPVAGAKVTRGQNWAEPAASRVTGANGRFQFMNWSPFSNPEMASLVGERVTVQAEGFAPQDRAVWATNRTEELRFTLGKGAVLRGRVTDEEGHPIANASVRVGIKNSDLIRFEWSAHSDEQGAFEWLNAPPTPQDYIVDAAGYEGSYRAEMTPNGTEHLVTLHTNAEEAVVGVSAVVVDAATKQPVHSFQLLMRSFHRAQGQEIKETKQMIMSPEIQAPAGELAFRTRGNVSRYSGEVLADGYWPHDFGGAGPITDGARFEIALEPATFLGGRVATPDGKPAVGAVAVLCMETSSEPAPAFRLRMTLPGKFDLRSPGLAYAITDEQGRFSLRPSWGATLIRIAHKTGYARVWMNHLAKSNTVTLEPWGRVEGWLKSGSHFVGNESVYLRVPEERFWSGFYLDLKVKSDAGGHFLIEGLPPGELEISRRLNFPGRSPATTLETQQRRISVREGHTTQVTLGGSGWLVTGKMKLSGPLQTIDWRPARQSFTTSIAGLPPLPAFPTRPDFTSATEFGFAKAQSDARVPEFWCSQPGQLAARQARSYGLVFDADGSFKIEDVAPGSYELTVTAPDPNPPSPDSKPRFYFNDPASGPSFKGRLTRIINLPELPEGSENANFDLGVLELDPTQP